MSHYTLTLSAAQMATLRQMASEACYQAWKELQQLGEHVDLAQALDRTDNLSTFRQLAEQASQRLDQFRALSSLIHGAQETHS